MKSLLVLLLVALSSATFIQDEEGIPCDQEISDLCTPNGPDEPHYIAVPDDCREYCECSNGVAYLFECGEDTLFDDDKMICDWAENVDCGNRTTPSPVSLPPI